MNLEELKNKIVIDHDSYTLSQGAISSDVDQWIKRYLPSGCLVINNATKNEESDRIVVSGKTDIFNIKGLSANVEFSLDNSGNVRIIIKTDLDAKKWTFFQSFPDIPGGEKNSLADIKYSECHLILSNQVVDNYNGFQLYTGINFYGVISESPLMTILEKTINIFPVMYGHINLLDSKQLVPLNWGEFPFSKDSAANPLPGYVFTVELKDYNSFEIKDVASFHDLGLKIYYPPNAEFFKDNNTYSPRFGFYGEIKVPAINLTTDCWINYVPQMSVFGIDMDFDGLSLGNLANLSSLCGGANIQGSLPDVLQKSQLEDLSITKLCIDFSLISSMPHLDDIMITIGMPNASWGILDDQYKIEGISSTFSYANDLMGEGKFGVRVEVIVVIKEHRLAVRASNTNNFTLYLNLMDAVDIPLEEFISAICPSLPKPTDLTINSISSEISPSNHVEIMARMASDGNEWCIPVGITTLKLSDILIYFYYDFTGKNNNDSSNYKGYYAGTLAFTDSLKLRASYAIPGGLSILANLPDFSLVEFINMFCNEKITLPGGFDLKLTNSAILFEENGGRYHLRLATLVNDFGLLMFEMRENANNTFGFVFGVNIDGNKFENIPGLSGLEAFNIFHLNNLVLIGSTLDDNNFQFPGTEVFHTPSFKGGGITIPGANGVVQGFNFMAEWELDTTSKEQNLLKNLLDIDAVMAIVLQIAASGAMKMYTRCDAVLCGYKTGVEFGTVLEGSALSFYAKGDIVLKIQGNDQKFALKIGFTPFGAFGAASMTGNQDVDFGWFKLGNLALQIGVDWEGIPSFGIAASLTAGKFNSSIAVLFDSLNPEKSMVAGSLSDLSLADVFEVFLDPACDSVTAVQESISDVLEVLDTFKIGGTNSFTLPGEMAQAFDDIDMEKISKGFSDNGISIPSNISQVFYSVGEKGSSWFITDLADSHMTHYEVFKKEDGSLCVSTEAQLYAAPVNTQIGEISYKAGFFINAMLQLYKFKVQATVLIDYSKGFLIDANMDKIDLANGLVCISGVDTSGADPKPSELGPNFHVCTYQEPYANIDAYVSILGMTHICKAIANKKGFDILYEYKNDLYSVKVESTLSGIDYFGAGLTMAILPNSFEVKDGEKNFGSVLLDTGAQASISIKIENITQISLTASLKLKLFGEEVDFGTFELSVDLKDIGDIFLALLDKIKDYIVTLFTDPKKFIEMVEKGFVKIVGALEDVVSSLYNITVDAAKVLIKEVEKLIDEVCPVENAVSKM